VRVAGRGYRDGVRNLEVMLESLSGGRRREIQEDPYRTSMPIDALPFQALKFDMDPLHP